VLSPSVVFHKRNLNTSNVPGTFPPFYSSTSPLPFFPPLPNSLLSNEPRPFPQVSFLIGNVLPPFEGRPGNFPLGLKLYLFRLALFGPDLKFCLPSTVPTRSESPLFFSPFSKQLQSTPPPPTSPAFVRRFPEIQPDVPLSPQACRPQPSRRRSVTSASLNKFLMVCSSRTIRRSLFPPAYRFFPCHPSEFRRICRRNQKFLSTWSFPLFAFASSRVLRSCGSACSPKCPPRE